MHVGLQTTDGMRAVFALRRFVYPPAERCELCRARLASQHSHLLETRVGQVRCACGACSERYGTPEEGFLPVNSRKDKLTDFALSDGQWDAFQIPIDLAFLVRRSDGLVALYPGPAGIIQAETNREAWTDLTEANPLLRDLAPEVEALAINRVHGRRDAWRLSIDHCFSLAGTLRKEWHGLSGGPKVWEEIEHYFDRDEALHA
ncbi:MAG TPA: DUF5947 family protein [Micropepsaceae bacterium]|jgi:hypothetical protein